MHTEPRPWLFLSWYDCPEVIESTEEFCSLPRDVQREVLAHWVWSMRHDVMRGKGLRSHYNFLKWEQAEEEAAIDILPGVTLNGHTVMRSEW